MFQQISQLFKLNYYGKSCVITMGDVGVGKSTIIENLTGEKNLSKQSINSVTRDSTFYDSKDLIIIDTPGMNSRIEKAQHNLAVAKALSYMPVNLILLIVVPGDRAEDTTEVIKKYLSRLLDFSLFQFEINSANFFKIF